MVPSLILQNLLHSKEYWRKVLPHIKTDYFDNRGDKLIFSVIESFSTKYGQPPTMDALAVEVSDAIGDDQDLAKLASDTLLELSQLNGEVESPEWLIDKTEEFCQEQSLHNAIRKSVAILDGREKDMTRGALPKLLSDALGISFDTRIGHDYLEDWEERFEEMHRVESQIPFDIEYLNLITKGGLRKKTLTAFMAPSGVGKSIFMCHMAASHLARGLNVMYVSCEMSEFRLAERIDMNIMNMTDEELKTLSREEFKKRVDKTKARSRSGKLLFKEYPTSTIGVAHIRALLQEAKQKRGFVPDVLYVDYLNIMISSRMRQTGENSYGFVKAIAEELRGLAVEFNIPIITATQTNRDGYDNSDIDMKNTSESMGLVHTLDLFLAIIQTEELASQNQVLMKQLKNRYRDENRNRKFVIGLDKSKMKLYDLEASAQKGLSSDSGLDKPRAAAPVRDFTTFS